MDFFVSCVPGSSGAVTGGHSAKQAYGLVQRKADLNKQLATAQNLQTQLKEIKPTATIAWKEVKYGPVRKAGKGIELYDVPFEAAEVLGVPDHVTQAALLPVAYFTGETFKAAPRLPAATVTHVDRWGTHPEG